MGGHLLGAVARTQLQSLPMQHGLVWQVGMLCTTRRLFVSTHLGPILPPGLLDPPRPHSV